MVQYNYPMGHTTLSLSDIYTVQHLLVPFPFEIPFSLHSGKWKYCMWLVINVEIQFLKIGFADSKWSHLIAPWSYTP